MFCAARKAVYIVLGWRTIRFLGKTLKKYIKNIKKLLTISINMQYIPCSVWDESPSVLSRAFSPKPQSLFFCHTNIMISRR